MKTLLVFTLFLILYPLPFITAHKAFAQDYSIDGGVVPQTNDNTSPAPTHVQTHGQFSGSNYKIQVGFENFDSELPLSFSVSESLIDYGQLLPTDPVSRVNILSVSSPTATGYTVQQYQNHSLKQNSSGVFIPDTTCDNGICTDKIAQPWNGTLTYGFGYRCDSVSQSVSKDKNACDKDFSDPNSYKEFSKDDSPQLVLAGNKDSSAQITYKVNISGTQNPQFYNNAITFLAVPNF